jgi:hypothetical protein
MAITSGDCRAPAIANRPDGLAVNPAASACSERAATARPRYHARDEAKFLEPRVTGRSKQISREREADAGVGLALSRPVTARGDSGRDERREEVPSAHELDAHEAGNGRVAFARDVQDAGPSDEPEQGYESFSVAESEALASEAERSRDLDRAIARRLDQRQSRARPVSRGYIHDLGQGRVGRSGVTSAA